MLPTEELLWCNKVINTREKLSLGNLPCSASSDTRWLSSAVHDTLDLKVFGSWCCIHFTFPVRWG